MHFAWQRDNTQVKGGKGAAYQTYEVAESSPEHAGTYTVKAWRESAGAKSDEVPGGECTVEITSPETPTAGQPQPLEWDAAFAKVALQFALTLGLAMLAVVALVMIVKASIAWTVAIGLLAIAAVLAAGAMAVALIDLRGRARATSIVGAKGLGEETAKAAADIFKGWGTLGLASAMMALAAIAMVSATTLGWRSLPDPGLATPTSSTTSTATSSPSASPSAPAGTSPAASAAPAPASTPT